MMANEPGLSASLEDYLESIFFTISQKTAARAKHISRRLGVNASSVTGALHALSDRGLINYDPYEVITLTEKGARTAREIARRHEAIRNFFVRVLGVDADEADGAACRVEHAIPRGILDKLIQFIRFVEACPRSGQGWIHAFQEYGKRGCLGSGCQACVSGCIGRFRDSGPKKSGRESKRETN